MAPASAARLFNDTYLVSWGLRRNCAVASTDKGGGNGVHDLTSNSVVLIDGTIANADAAGKDSSFTAPSLTGAARTDFLAKYPNRISLKYYGKRNPMAEQGDDVLMAAKFALSELNEVYGIPLANGAKSVRFTKDNTITILVGVSSGGGGAMMGAEKDIDGYFSGVVAFEPAVNPAANPKVSVTRAGKTFQSTGTSILDFISMENIYMPCAGRADSTWPGYANLTTGDSICASLHDKGLVAGNTPADQANDAVRKLLNYGFDPAGTWEYPTNGDLAGPQHAIANAYMQTGVDRVLCGITAALTVDAHGTPTAPTTTQLAQMWVTTGTYNPMPIYENSVGGPVRSTLAVSPSTGRADSGLDGKLCLQAIKTGTSAESDTYRAGELAAGHTGNLHGKPTILMQGREDVRLPATLTSRMYAGLNSVVEGSNSNLHFYEVTNIAHAGGTPSRLVPVQYYAYTALTWMWNHLKNGTPLPPDQVIRTIPRGTNPDGSARDLTVNDVPSPVANPKPADSIAVTNG
ncbi:MAG TPA: 3-hydroxybutyrate oligomer hydrolase family protein, partial [Terriglobales bacterium]